MFEEHPNLYYDTKKGLRVSHLAYANDLVIFCRGSNNGLRRVMGFLKHYEHVSGQKISFEKSNFFVGKRGNGTMIQNLTGINVKEMPFTYLGAPIEVGRKRIDLFNPLTEKIRGKFSGWCLNMLSQGGRLILIKSVLSSMSI